MNSVDAVSRYARAGRIRAVCHYLEASLPYRILPYRLIGIADGGFSAMVTACLA